MNTYLVLADPGGCQVKTYTTQHAEGNLDRVFAGLKSFHAVTAYLHQETFHHTALIQAASIQVHCQRAALMFD